MILVAHQPEYLPYLGFFAKVSLCNHFLLSDHLQYATGDFQNRNYLRGPNGKLLLTVPVLLGDRWDQPIREVRIHAELPWAKKHWKSIEQNYGRAPYFDLYANRLREIYAAKWERLCELNVELIRAILGWLSFDVRVGLTSEYGLTQSKTDLLLEMCEKVNADVFISGRGARAYVELEKFQQAGRQHLFFDFVHPEYDQRTLPFIPNLSILDALFNLGPATRDLVNEAVSRSPLSPV